MFKIVMFSDKTQVIGEKNVSGRPVYNMHVWHSTRIIEKN